MVSPFRGSSTEPDLNFKRSKTVIGEITPAWDAVDQKKLPKGTGSNKYTEKMVPGYTGYMPRVPFKFGNTYKRVCDSCIDEFKTNWSNHGDKMDELRRQVASHPPLTAISYDPLVRDKLNLYRDTHPPQPILLEDKRPLLEPPIPGYAGFIPRINPTEIGLGQRYHNRTDMGLQDFGREQGRERAYRSAPIVTRPGAETEAVKGSSFSAPFQPTPPNFSRRIYPNGGMIPKYTGYVPQRRYVFGNTYGDTTRSLEVCNHKMLCYGDYVKTQPYPPPIVPC
nr:hypothetical protein BaRGS_016217 [Batillaria attramentaria]